MPAATLSDARLIERIRESAVLHGDFTLRSGRRSRYYIDKYLFETEPDILAALADRFARHVDGSIDRLAGAELGGIPLVSATALATGKPMVLIRNQKKGYGTAKRIEGRLEPGDRVLILEDVATSGGQSLEAAQTLADAGATVAGVVVVIDRLEGAREAVEDAGFPFTSLFTTADLGLTDVA